MHANAEHVFAPSLEGTKWRLNRIPIPPPIRRGATTHFVIIVFEKVGRQEVLGLGRLEGFETPKSLGLRRFLCRECCLRNRKDLGGNQRETDQRQQEVEE